MSIDVLNNLPKSYGPATSTQNKYLLRNLMI